MHLSSVQQLSAAVTALLGRGMENIPSQSPAGWHQYMACSTKTQNSLWKMSLPCASCFHPDIPAPHNLSIMQMSLASQFVVFSSLSGLPGSP